MVGGVRGCRWWHIGPPGPALPLAGIKPSPGPRSPNDGFLWADGRSVKLLLPCKGTLAAQDVGIIRGVSPSHSHHNDSSCRTRLWMIHIWSTIGLRICCVPCSYMYESFQNKFSESSSRNIFQLPFLAINVHFVTCCIHKYVPLISLHPNQKRRAKDGGRANNKRPPTPRHSTASTPTPDT